MWNMYKVYLFQYLDQLTNGASSIRILLPLCGKSGDLMWLYQQVRYPKCEKVEFVEP
jgi:hypothetical protein